MLRLLLGFLVPTIYLGIGVLAKKGASQAVNWRWSDGYLGLEWTLAALTVSVLNACDLYRLGDKEHQAMVAAAANAQTVGEREGVKTRNEVHAENLEEIRKEEGRNTLILALAFVAFLVALVLHRQWEPQPDSRTKHVLLLGVANFCGYVPMACYMLFVKGV